MAIVSIRLQNFRSYVDDSFEFEPGVNVVVGPNGSGKTNLLEALLVVATGSSYRVTDEDMIQFDKSWARVDVFHNNINRTLKIEQDGVRVTKSYVFDDKPSKILSFQNTLPVVLFEPNHLQLLHGQPDLRRKYLDDLLEKTTPSYKTLMKHYKRALSQRNALLKAYKKPTQDQLFIWNIRLSELGGAVVKERVQLIEKNQQELPSLYNDIAGSAHKTIQISYATKLRLDNYETALLQALEGAYEKDTIRGFTTYGPHRDDFLVCFNDHPAEDVASRGETRTALLALKIFELQLLEERSGQKPLLLLDDVFSELDGKRRHQLTDHLQKYQTFITTTDADVVVQTFLNNCKVIPLGG
jgi:DNA replication and repair protein RecF